MQGEPIAPEYTQSFSCLAVIKKDSLLAQDWALKKPSVCIFEYDRRRQQHEIQFEDGSWQCLEPDSFDEVVLLRPFDKQSFDAILGPIREKL